MILMLNEDQANELSLIHRLLLELDEKLVSSFFSLQKDKSYSGKINPLGHESSNLDLHMEEIVIDFFKEKSFPCIIISEEIGVVKLVDKPTYFVVIDPVDGSTNASMNIPLVATGISIGKIKNHTDYRLSQVLASFVRSYFTNELFYSSLYGTTRNGLSVKTSKKVAVEDAVIGIDFYCSDLDNLNQFLPIIHQAYGVRRFGANLLDMAYVSSGQLDAILDFREITSSVHISGLHLIKCSGGKINNEKGKEEDYQIGINQTISFVASGSQKLNDEIIKLWDKKG